MSEPDQSSQAGQSTQSPPPLQRPLREQKWVIITAACIAGVMIGYGLAGFAPKTPDWKRDAAQHHALYRGWTVSPLSPTSADLESRLTVASSALGVDLSLAALSSQDTLLLKDVQVLGIRDSRLVQILYAAPGGTPVALYMIKRRSNSKWTASELTIEPGMRAGLASGSWSAETVDLMLVGGDNQNQIGALAENLRGRVFREGQS